MTTHWKFWRIFLFSCIDCSSFCILILLIRNFIFILPTVFMCKTTSNPYWQKYYYMFPTHTHVVKVRCRRGPWLGVFPLKSIRSHETCAHTLSNKCPGQLCNTLYTQHTVQYTIYEWKVSITTSLRKGIIRGQKVTKQSLKKGVWRCIAQLRSTLNS